MITEDFFEEMCDTYGEFYFCGTRYANLSEPDFDPNEFNYPAVFSECISEDDIGEEYPFVYEAEFPIDSMYTYEDMSEGVMYMREDSYRYDIDDMASLSDPYTVRIVGGFQGE